ncbi:MAG: 2-C-methyl-D-erythritol 2,4-cyclodiphosphate synthase [Acutalibacteraceae bacterium]|jgi:2-C-methyl-D-erythritol 4-phosphate cytidylyltransferase/2-C-methyl-D-erythritol 2,4-cyclodiphosphate synthase
MSADQALTAIIVAAGSSTRMGRPKQWIVYDGLPVLGHTLRAFELSGRVNAVVVVTRKEDIAQTGDLCARMGLRKVVAVVPGGNTRQRSVKAGMDALPANAALVAIHDGARPFVSAELIARVADAAQKTGAAAAAVAVKDTVKIADGQGLVQSTPDRRTLWSVQTPQIFDRRRFADALEKAFERGLDLTDDCGVMEAAGYPVTLCQGDYRNVKITTPEDLAFVEKRGDAMRIGHGYDVHRLVPGRALILGGVNIPHETGLLGHSDADVLLHAIMDALLGAAAMGDIGCWFPDTDERYEGADSMALLRETVRLIADKGYRVGNIDATVLAQAPKLKPFIPQMRQNVAAACGISVEQVSVKATTEEGLGFTGQQEGIAAHAVCLLEK